MLESQKLGGSHVRIPKVGGVRTPPTRAVAAPMDAGVTSENMPGSWCLCIPGLASMHVHESSSGRQPTLEIA